MIERIEGIEGAVIKAVTIDDDPPSQEHHAYRITIETDRGTVVISGCHDMGPTIDPDNPFVTFISEGRMFGGHLNDAEPAKQLWPRI